MTLILFCMSIVLAQDCTQACNVCSQPPCTFCPGHFGYTPDLSTSELIFEVYSPMGVSSDPEDTSFTIPMDRTITDIGTYHWYGQVGSVGTIGLQNVDSGTIYGPWQASGYAGMNGAQDVYWVASPHVYLPAGTYKIVDSDQSTWSYAPNDCTGSKGLCWVFAQKENADGSPTSSNPIGKSCSWTGKWDGGSGWGIIELQQSDNTVTGTYPYEEGQLRGVLSGNKLVGTWSQTRGGKPISGDIEWTMSTDCNSFTGNWKYHSEVDKRVRDCEGTRIGQ